MSWDKGLTEEQKHAASITGRHVRLLAGPGTGKTTCITSRVVYLISEKNVKPENIIVLTFTRAAASELRERIANELETLPATIKVQTLHSYALTTLLQSRNSNRLPLPIRIADDYEQEKIIYPEIGRLLSIKEVKEVKMFFSNMESNWQKLDGNNIPSAKYSKFLGAWQKTRQTYGYTLRSELLYQLNQAFTDGAIIPEAFSHVIVDE